MSCDTVPDTPQKHFYERTTKFVPINPPQNTIQGSGFYGSRGASKRYTTSYSAAALVSYQVLSTGTSTTPGFCPDVVGWGRRGGR